MVTPGGLKVKAPKVSSSRYNAQVFVFAAFSLVAGYVAATQPSGEGWRFFSYHPFLMTCGYVGLMGTAALTRKLGGYANTKLHGILGWSGLMMAFGGLYVIYTNKELNEKDHFTSNHSLGGLMALGGSAFAGMAGGVFLHPDFGIAQTNKLYRTVHQWFGRFITMIGWGVCFSGLMQLTDDTTILAMYGLPLLALIPFTLM